MTFQRRRAFLVSFIVIGVSASVAAQPTSQQPAPPAPSPTAVTRSDSAGVDYLAKRYGVSRQSASERLQLEKQVSDLALSVASNNPAQFGGIFIEHQPVYQIIVLFTDAENRTAFRESVAPELRRYVQVRKASRSEQETRSVTTVS